MAAAVLAEIDLWFEQNVFAPLRAGADPRRGIEEMFAAVENYFWSGRRVCLVGAFALGDPRDRFAEQIRGYFVAWTTALASALVRTGFDGATAADRAEETVVAIQGALVLARALDDPAAFLRALDRARARLR
jgi:TetR/AcrR family transcriptional regulator, lmrAB and yxaGH operons repressor